MLEASLLLALAVALAYPLGHYLAHVLRAGPSPVDRIAGPIEHPLYRALTVNPDRGMSALGYLRAFLLTNAVLLLAALALLMSQGALPLNPDGVPSLNWDLAIHTAVSFLTNTNQQHYAGQAQLSHLSQTLGIVTLQVLTPMMGLALAAATLRALFGGRNAATASEGQPRDVGNYYADVIRLSVRVCVPLSFVVALILGSQGVPATWRAAVEAAPIDPTSGVESQRIPLGPVAPMVATKQLGTNGGGWYGPNSAVPLENPTPLSNAVQTIAIVLLPMAVVFMLSPFTGRRRLSALVFVVMAAFSVVFVGASLWSEQMPNAGLHGLAPGAANLEGKELRFGADASALWATLTTQTSNGSVNAMHDSLNPLTGLVSLCGMLINAVWGGVGCGFSQFFVYLVLAVFLSGLMIGRTPELFGRKLEVREMRLIALLILLQPLVVLGLTAFTVANPALAGTSNPGFHGLSQVLYEYTSAFANNGSGLEGLADNTPWWNLSCALALILGRYPALLIPLLVAASLGRKRVAPVGPGSLVVESPTFALTLMAVIVLLTVLTFLPVLVLGPIGEALTLR
jgi:potassium-transporting ATPase potassium-binding subunit